MLAVCKKLTCLRPVLARSITNDALRIGSVARPVTPRADKDQSLVPILYYEKNLFPPSFVRHLEWLMKKDNLGQDALFVGPPGPTRRRLVLAYLELNRKPYQYIQLTRDTTDSDIKQRREIQNKTALFINQAAVNAAIHGHTLVLDGLEKTERNVLPILNNLLENREMNLDDGQFLVSTQRFDELLKFYTHEQLQKLNFIRVHEDFRVIALTLPPLAEYKGNSLDPPLRSRFQLRDIGNEPLTFPEYSTLLKSLHPTVDAQFVEQLLSFASLVNATDLETLKLTHFPLDRLDHAVRLAELIPTISLSGCLQRIYPYEILYGNVKESKQAIRHMFKKIGVKQQDEHPSKKLVSLNRQGLQATVACDMDGKSKQITVPAHDSSSPVTPPTFIKTPYHDELLTDLVLSHAVGDMCLVGPKGCGKSLIVDHFAALLNYPIEYFVLYKDLSARELLQQRITNANGDTLWQNTPLVEAALHGRLLVLDGVHRLNNDTLVSLQRLIQDRELFLPDGTRLLRHDRYDQLQNPPTNIRRIHPSFRIVALAEPPTASNTPSGESSAARTSSEQNWLNAETLNLFLYHHMRSLSLNEERQIVYSLLSSSANQPNPAIEHLLQFVHELRNSEETQLKTVARSLSTRNVLRIAKHLQSGTSNYRIRLREQLIRQTSAPFLPRLVQDAFYEALAKSGLEALDETTSLAITWKQSTGDQQGRQAPFEHAAKVPFTVFYENPIHSVIIQQMHQSFSLGEHLLLIGPQGVAKNRIVDHYLQTLKLPREYIQLHRDTTVQSLTIQANIIDGRIVYEDSPLIKAIKEGSVAVIDEADKAPTNVTGILKSLIESGSMFLSDGRRVYPREAGSISTIPSNLIIRTHPNFRMIVLANRPGFPFLGNDFFLSLGDHFSTFPILNPPRESEIILLQNFAPNLERKKLEQLVDVFTELRQLSTDGIISYPYSLRELVSIVKHLNLFPNESVADVVRNVFDLDNYNTDVIDRIRGILHRHGIPFHVQRRTVNLATSHPLKVVASRESWPMRMFNDGDIEQSSSPIVFSAAPSKQPTKVIHSIHRNDSRTENFSELIFKYRLPIDETTFVHDLNVLKESQVVLALTGNPLLLWTFKLGENQAKRIDLNSVFAATTNRFTTPNYQLCVIPGNEKQVVVGDLTSQSWVLIDLADSRCSLIQSSAASFSPLTQTITRKFNEMLSQRTTLVARSAYNPTTGQLLQYQFNQPGIHVMDFAKNISQQLKLPIPVRHVTPLGDQWVLTDHGQQTSASFLLNTTTEGKASMAKVDHHLDTIGLASSGGQLESKSLWFSSSNDYLSKVVTENDASLTVERFKRSKPISTSETPPQDVHEKRRLQTFLNKEHSLVASFYGKNEVDKKFIAKDNTPDTAILSYLELLDLNRHLVTYIPIQRAQEQNARSSISQHEWHLLTKAASGVLAAQCLDGSLVTIDSRANIHHWEIVPSHLQISLDAWSQQFGRSGEHSLDIEYLKDPKTDLSGPKHGKVDPENQPHVGGNQWAGGSGGRDTAGLGGIGGPYRLDSGHQVYQVPDDVKAAVPEHIRKAARELGQKVFKERLKEIEMSEYEHEVYEKYLNKIASEIKMLRSIIESLEAKSHDRQWVRHRTTGDWDERKLIEGIIGEKSIYKYRADVPPEPGSPQTKAKRLRLVVDLSASMYRFNGVDNRLERQCECVLMFLESLAGFEHKFAYDIVGHSGDEDSIELVRKNQAPKNNKERLKLIKLMYTHTMFCSSGDNTFPALKKAIDDLQAEPDDTVDERFVIVISDANFDRYGMSPKVFGKMLQSNENVQCFAMFIGSLGPQAIHLQQNLPSGKGFVCLETSQIPKVLKTIFTSDVLH